MAACAFCQHGGPVYIARPEQRLVLDRMRKDRGTVEHLAEAMPREELVDESLVPNVTEHAGKPRMAVFVALDIEAYDIVPAREQPPFQQASEEPCTACHQYRLHFAHFAHNESDLAGICYVAVSVCL